MAQLVRPVSLDRSAMPTKAEPPPVPKITRSLSTEMGFLELRNRRLLRLFFDAAESGAVWKMPAIVARIGIKAVRGQDIDDNVMHL